MNRHRNPFGLRWNISKHCFEIVTRSRLWSTVSKRGTHLADSFFIPNCSCKIKITVPCDMPVASTHSRTFTRQTNIVDFIDDFWRSSLNWTSRTRCIACECTITFKFIHPIVYSRKRWCRCAMNIIQLDFDFFRRFICRYLITARNSFFSILQKIQRLFTLIIYRNETTRWIPLRIWQ